jgi:hypothetical protein
MDMDESAPEPPQEPAFGEPATIADALSDAPAASAAALEGVDDTPSSAPPPAAELELPPASTWTIPLDALPDPEPSDYEFAVAILERLRAFAPILTDGLIDTLGKCDKGRLVRLFGLSPSETAPDDLLAPEPELPAEPELPPHLREPQQEPDRGQVSWTWNDAGYRTSPRLPSSFLRQELRRGGSHWSR